MRNDTKIQNRDGLLAAAAAYELGCRISEEDVCETARFFKMAADWENRDGQNMYGQCLWLGQGVEKNTDEAARYYKMAVRRLLRDETAK